MCKCVSLCVCTAAEGNIQKPLTSVSKGKSENALGMRKRSERVHPTQKPEREVFLIRMEEAKIETKNKKTGWTQSF